MFHHSVYADEILDLTISGACPQDYLRNHMDQDACLLMDDLKKDESFLQLLNQLDPTGENRKQLKGWYLAEQHRKKTQFRK